MRWSAKKVLLFACWITIAVACNQKEEAIPEQKIWVQKNDFSGGIKNNGIAFAIGDKGYIGLGNDETLTRVIDLWEYSPRTDSWTRKADFPGNNFCGVVSGFSVGNKGYVLNFFGDFFEYDPEFDTWTQKAAFPGLVRPNGTGFSIGDKGYYGTGNGQEYKVHNDFWEYNPVTDAWSRKADFPGNARTGARGFAIGNKGYVGLGGDRVESLNCTYFKDVWEYNPLTNQWTPKAAFPGAVGGPNISFCTAERGYVAFVANPPLVAQKSFWEFDPSANIWREIQPLPMHSFIGCQSFSVRNMVYLTGGNWLQISKAVWQFNP